MNLPVGITAQETFHGRGDFTTLLAIEDGQEVVVKTPNCSEGYFGDLDLNDSSVDDGRAAAFKLEKDRENKIADVSGCFLRGRMLENEGAIFWVRPYMRRSLKDMVSFKEKPDTITLGRICQKIVSALVELNRFDQSGHGNLSLGNVLFSQAGFSDLRLVDVRTPNAANHAADKRALGLIIYQLVNGEFVELDDRLSSVPNDQHWKFLGAAGGKWREFCSELLNPFGEYAQSSWDDIEKVLKEIVLSSGKRGKMFAGISLLLVGVVAVVLFFKFRSDEEKIIVDDNKIQGQWLELLDAYFSWGGVYLRSKSDFKESRNEPEFVKRFYDVDKASLPTLVIGKVSGQGAKLLKSPDEAYDQAKLVDVLLLDEVEQKRIIAAHQVMNRIRTEVEEWSVLQKLQESHQAFTESGFEYGAEETQRLLSSISFEDGTLTLSRLYALQSSVRALDEMQGLYDQLDSYITRFGGQSTSGFLSLNADFLTQRLGQASADDPVEYLRDLVTDAAELNDFWENASSRLQHDLFRTSENEFLSQPNFEISQSTINDWKALVEDFSIIELPVLNEVREKFRRAQETLQELTKQINDLNEEGAPRATYDQAFVALANRFTSEIDIPLILRNQQRIENILDIRSRELDALISEAKNRWAEVNPDIFERLQTMVEPLNTISGALFTQWEAYLDREVRILSEASFAGPKEFIAFQRAYLAKRRSFQSFYDDHLSRVSGQLPSAQREQLSTEMVPIVDSVRQAFYLEMINAWVDEVSPKLLDGKGDSSLDAITNRYESEMSEYDRKLVAYSSLISSGIQAIDEWNEPQGGFVQLWDRLQADKMYIDWGRNADFRPYLQRIELFNNLARETDVSVLLKLVLDSGESGYVRLSALERISALNDISHELILELEPIVSKAEIKTPSHRKSDYEMALKKIWSLAYEQVITDFSLREKVFLLANTYGVKSADLSGSARVDYELFSAYQLLIANKELYLEKPALLTEVINELATLPEFKSDQGLQEIVRDLREVDLEKVESTFAGAEFTQKGWRVKEESREKLVLEWQGKLLNFRLVEGPVGNYFVSETECSIELFNDWMTENKLWEQYEESLPADMSYFMNKSYDPGEDYRYGMTLWQVSRRGLARGGLELAEKLYLKIFETEEQEFSELEIGSQSVLSVKLPIQYLSARLAGQFAESMGMMLPTPKLWELLTAQRQASNSFFWQGWMDDNEKLSSSLAKVLRNDSFYETQKIESSGFGAERPRLLSRVDEAGNEDIKHLAGNVAEYLYDPEASQFYVAGGSALSASANTWKSMHLIDRKTSQRSAFSDVGLRLALIAPEQSAYFQYLQILMAYRK